MPLITCEDCGKEHSDLAPACPSCGRPSQASLSPLTAAGKPEIALKTSANRLNRKNNGCLVGCLSIFGLFILLSALGSLGTKSIKPPAPSPGTEESDLTPLQESAPPGWETTDKPGVYWRWCTNDSECSTDKVLGENKYSLMQVWCKERACGDIYGQVNLISSAGVVVGWTNDTGYGDIGQKVQLTFDSHQDGWERAQLTKLNIRE